MPLVDTAELAPSPAEELLAAIARQPDFPSMPSLLPDVRRIARCERSRVQTLSGALLKDIGLTQRLLRLVNAACYRSAGAGQIATVTRAVAVMGFDAIGRHAVAARLVEAANRGPQAIALREECLRALLAANIAERLGAGAAGGEDAYVAALFRNVGRLLVGLHRPPLLRAMRAEAAALGGPRAPHEEQHARRALGRGASEIGRELATRWGWPGLLREAMRRDADGGRTRVPDGQPLLAAVVVADELADALLYDDEPGVDRCAEQALAAMPAGAGFGLHDLRAVLADARRAMPDLAAALDLSLGALNPWASTRADGPGADGLPAAIPPAAATITPHEPLRGSELLAAAIQDLSAALVGDGDAAESVPGIALEALWRGLEAERALLCLRRGARGPLQPVLALGGEPAARWQERAVVDAERGDDLLALLARRGADTLLEDAREPRIAARLPAWLREPPPAAPPARLMVLPLARGGQPLGLVYLDAASPQALQPDEQALRLARTLRNQMLLAIGYGRG